jgi:RNA polymerase sigma-70 factor, ECF subfamily
MEKAAQPGEAAAGDVSKLLGAWSGGDQSALERPTPIVYDELHRLAPRYMKRERPGHSLQTTALVNEAYMRLVDYERIEWQDRGHARRRDLKCGAGVQRITLEEAAVVGGGRPAGPVALDDAMNAQARREWSTARLWLHRELAGGAADGL